MHTWKDQLTLCLLMLEVEYPGELGQYQGNCCPGPCLNINTVFLRYGDSHVKDKTVTRPSYFQHGDPSTGKTTSLYWDDPQAFCVTGSIATTLLIVQQIGPCFSASSQRAEYTTVSSYFGVKPKGWIRSSDFWPQGSLHTLGADGHILTKRSAFYVD